MVARDLARRGRELNRRMKEKHQQAAQEIFASRNPGDQVKCEVCGAVHGECSKFQVEVSRVRSFTTVE